MAAIGPGIDIRIIGDQKSVQRALHVLDTALNPLALVEFLTGEVVPYLAERGKARFAGEGDDVSGNWIPLSPATEQIRSSGRTQGLWSVGDAHPINVRTHELENYITSGIGSVLPQTYGASAIYPRPSASVGDIEAKMNTAQFGSSEPNTPPRPVLGMNEADAAAILTALAFHIKKVGMQL